MKGDPPIYPAYIAPTPAEPYRRQNAFSMKLHMERRYTTLRVRRNSYLECPCFNSDCIQLGESKRNAELEANLLRAERKLRGCRRLPRRKLRLPPHMLVLQLVRLPSLLEAPLANQITQPIKHEVQCPPDQTIAQPKPHSKSAVRIEHKIRTYVPTCGCSTSLQEGRIDKKIER